MNFWFYLIYFMLIIFSLFELIIKNELEAKFINFE